MKYTNAWIEKGYFDARAVQRVRNVIVEIGWRTILVQWHEGARLYRYEGVRNGQGHFLLRSDDATGNATLHRFQYSMVLEGFWKRNSKSGFWRIHLPENAHTEVMRMPAPVKPLAAARRKPARRIRAAA